MLFIETKGTWHDMGAQIGEAFADQLHRCVERYSPWLQSDPGKYAAAIDSLRSQLDTLCPELLEETAGLADAANLDPDLALGFRFFNEIRQRASDGCSVVYLGNSDAGPLLGRNCDLSPGFEADIQLCRICRPESGWAIVHTSYLGMAGGVGLNEHGLGIGGASAHTDRSYGRTGLPGQVLNFLLLHRCRDARDARDLMAQHPFLGKSLCQIAGDAGGDSVLFEMAPGRTAVQIPRPSDAGWQVCTNFFVSGEIPTLPEPEYLQSAYARYGRMVHLLDSGLAQYTVLGMKQLLTDIAQPGACDTGRDGKVKTAYSQLLDLAGRAMHVTPGHPAEESWKEVSL